MAPKKTNAKTINWKSELLAGGDVVRELFRDVLQEVLEAEMTETLQTRPGERMSERLGLRSGYYSRTLITQVGKLELCVPQDRQGRFSTQLFERYNISSHRDSKEYIQVGLLSKVSIPRSLNGYRNSSRRLHRLPI